MQKSRNPGQEKERKKEIEGKNSGGKSDFWFFFAEEMIINTAASIVTFAQSYLKQPFRSQEETDLI